MPGTARPYASEADYARMRCLVTEIYNINGPPVYATVGDLDWWRFTDDDPDAAALARLWMDADTNLVGIAWPSGDQVDLLVHPHYREIEDEMLAWAEQQRRAAQPRHTEDVSLRAWGYTGDTARTALLQRRGYERTDNFIYFRSCRLDTPIPEPRLPPEYTLRHVRGEADIEQRVAVHRNAFAPSRMTVAKHRAVMQAPTYRADLDLIVVAPDGTFAAFCIVWFDEVNQTGVFEPVGCHADHRQRGLGKAILYEGMRRLKALGAHTAHVGGWGSAVAATRLYEAVGLREVDRMYAWKKWV